MKKVLSSILAILLLVLGSVGCSNNQKGDKPLVAVSIMPFQEFVEQIAGNHVDVTTMIPQGSDPHTFDPAPSQIAKLSNADMYVKVGAGLEFEIAYMDKITAMNSKMLIVDASHNIALLDNEDEDSSSLTNPHIWLSPRNAITICSNICDGLCEIDPDNSLDYLANYAKYVAKLVELDSDITDGLSNVTNRSFMVLHPQWEYFAEDYGLTEFAIEVDGKEPGAQTLAELINVAKSNNIKVVFTSPQFSDASANAIAKEIKGSVVKIDGLAKNYIENMYSILSVMKDAME